MNAQDLQAKLTEALTGWPTRPQLPGLALHGTPGLDRALATMNGLESALPTDLDEARLLAVIQRVEELHRGTGAPLGRRDLGRLAWAFDHGAGTPLYARPSFTTALRLFQGPQRPRVVLGLIEGYWRTACQDRSRLEAWANLIARELETSPPGKSEVLDHWRRYAGLVFLPGRGERLAGWLWETGDPRKRLQALWHDPRETPRMGHRLVQECLEAACRGLPFHGNAPDAAAIEVLVAWLESLIRDFRQDHVWLKRPLESLLVRLAGVDQVQPIRSLLSLVIRLFNDPRLATGQSWGDLDVRARELVVRWLARRDLEFFFRALSRSMDSRRHAFWMGYVDQITYTRLVLGEEVYVDPAYRAEFEKERREGRHALMKGNTQLAALIIKIGKLTLIEFSLTGHAAYWYLDPLPIDLHLKRYGVNDLKIPMRYVGPAPGGEISVQDFLVGSHWKGCGGASEADNRFTHSGNWQPEVANYLAALGIRRPVNRPSTVTTGTVQLPPRSIAETWKPTTLPPSPPATARGLDELLLAMKRKGLEVVDMRTLGGAVWLLPGPELQPFLEALRQQGWTPRWVEGGGTATGHRPAYYVKVN